MITTEQASITILVSYPKGKEIAHQIVPFKVYKDNNSYTAIPMINGDERKQTGLPEELNFSFRNQTIVPGKASFEGSQQVLENIVKELKLLRTFL